MLTSNLVITGDRVKNIADVWLGLEDDFCSDYSNKKIKYMNTISMEYDNPSVVFCFCNSVEILAEKIDYFKNDFTLITHDSKFNIECNNESVIKILNNDKLKRWFTENLCFDHKKMCFLPSGIANNDCSYGRDFLFFYDDYSDKMKNPSNREVYMSFTITKNMEKRSDCYINMREKVVYLPYIDSLHNFWRFSSYQFCVCPEGTGIDTNRIWEAMYLKIVPIVVRNPFVSILEKFNFPIVILESWSDFDVEKLPEYKSFDFSKILCLLDINYYKSIIRRL
jgi:hypothetical protein